MRPAGSQRSDHVIPQLLPALNPCSLRSAGLGDQNSAVCRHNGLPSILYYHASLGVLVTLTPVA